MWNFHASYWKYVGVLWL